MAELADAQDLGSCGVLRAGSSPVTRTKAQKADKYWLLGFLFYKKRQARQIYEHF